ncbi:MAG: MBOAT family protein [Clostridium sp.]|nr:MBOAT family protein [Clostridium sp.]
MVFSSIFFLFYFLPFVLIVYFIVPRKFRNYILLISSLIFYAWGEPKYIWIMLFSTFLDYTCGKRIHYNNEKKNFKKAKLWLLVSILINLSLLGFFKYSDFIISNFNNALNTNIPLFNLILPIGISFYTFQTMSYTIDLYRGKVDVQNNLISFGTYVTLFPQLIAGPIVRYKTVEKEIDNRIESFHLVSEGIKRFIIGLAKKVLLANNIGLVWNNISKGNYESSVLISWLGIIAFGFQIYFDFSGYSDMAIGLGKIFGFNFLENFNYPYMSRSITEFWRRWHISLGSWFKEYVYIPLGGNKRGLKVQIRNILIVWALTGIWHGASWNFLVWGIYFGLILAIEKLFLYDVLEKIPGIFSRLYSIFLILISWVIFAFDSLEQSFIFMGQLFGKESLAFYNSDFLYLITSNIIMLVVLFVASTDIPKKIWKSLKKKYNPNLIYMSENIFLLLIFILSISYLVDQSYNPFLYFRF